MICFKFFVLLLLTLLLASALYSQSTEIVEKRKSLEANVPPAFQNLITDTYYVPAEFAIEILLQVTKSPKISPVKKKEILLEAYRKLDEVQQPIEKKIVLDGASTDTRQNLLSKSFAQKLDAISLRNKIFKELLKLDKKKVRELIFQNQLEFPLRTVTCEDALDYKIDGFYETLTLVARESFTTDEKKRGSRLFALTPYVQNIKSSVQITPISKMILSLDLTPTESGELILSFSSAVKKFSTTDRSFFVSFVNDLNSFEKLIALANDQNIHKETLTDSFRNYIIKHLQGERCADNIKSYEVYTPSVVKWLNQNSLSALPLSNEDIKFEKLADSAKIDDFWKSNDSQNLLSRLKSLRFNTSTDTADELQEMVLKSKAQKQEIEWKRQFAETLREIENWDGRNEKDEAVYFHQKCILYRGLTEIAAEESERVKTLESYEKFLAGSSIQKESPMEWFLHSSELINLARENFKRENAAEFRLISNSKNSVFRIYADLISLEAK